MLSCMIRPATYYEFNQPLPKWKNNNLYFLSQLLNVRVFECVCVWVHAWVCVWEWERNEREKDWRWNLWPRILVDLVFTTLIIGLGVSVLKRYVSKLLQVILPFIYIWIFFNLISPKWSKANLGIWIPAGWTFLSYFKFQFKFLSAKVKSLWRTW